MTQKQRTIFAILNWKTNPEKESLAVELTKNIKKTITKKHKTNIILTPSFVHLSAVSKILGNSSSVFIGTQTVSRTNTSATGEVSSSQLKNLGVKYCIVGHSESRALGFSNEDVANASLDLLKKGITPIVCIGEQTRDTDGTYLKEITNQLTASLAGLTKAQAGKIVIAYEPLWAIGKESAQGSEIHEVAILIRRTLSDMLGFTKIPTTPILYGGGVQKPSDIVSALTLGSMDGVLVGRASLSVKTLTPLLKQLETIANT